MAFDSTGLQGRLKIDYTRHLEAGLIPKKIWENTGCEAHQRHAGEAWQLITNRKCHKAKASGLYCLTEYYSILQQPCMCACVCARSCAQLQHIAALPERKSDLAPKERSSCTAWIKEQPNWSRCTVFLLLLCSWTQMCTHTHTSTAHIYTCPTARILVCSSP